MNRRWSSLTTTGVVCAASSLLALGCGCHVDTTGKVGDSAVLDGGGGGSDGTVGTDGGPGTDSAVPLDAGANDAPVLVLDMPPGLVVFGDVPYGYTLIDADGDPCSIAVTYAAGAAAAPATEGGGDGTTGLAATPGGVAHTYVWDSLSDVPGDVDGVDVCFTPNDGTVDGATVCAPAANVRNTTVPTAGIKINEVGVGIPDYVEVVNSGTVAVDLSAWQVLWVSGNGTSGAMVVPPLVMMPGDVVELREGAGMDTATVVHIGSNAEWDQALGGSVDLVDAALAGVDFVRWGGDASSPSAPGLWTEAAPLPVPANNTEGLSRIGALDTDDAADFCVTGASPGAPNPPCPPPPVPIAAGDILIAEVDTGDFGGIPDTIELYNRSAADINLSGAILRIEDEGFVTSYPLPGFLLAAGARVLVADNTGTAGPDTIVLPDNINWSGATFSMSVGLEDGFGGGVDFVGFGGSTETPAPPVTWTGAVPVVGAGGSASRVPDATDTDSDADWCVSIDTPLGANSCQLTAADVSLVVTELNTSIPDWLEVANLGATDVDLLGWSLEFTPGGFGGPDVFTFMTSAVVPAGGFLVIADGDPGAPFYDTGFFNIAWGPAPSVGSLALRDPAGTGEDFVRWGGDPTAPPPGTGWTEAAALPGLGDAEFLNRTITAGGLPSDTDDAADWCVHTTSTIGAANTTCP